MPNYLTKEGLDKIKKELDYLKNIKRKEIKERLRYAVSLGDLRENFAYHEAKDEQAFLERRILELEAIIREAKIIEKKTSSKITELGSVVTLLTSDKKKKKFQMVGREEADPIAGKISFTSPLGQAILGKKVGEIVEVETPSGKEKYKILKIE